MKYIKTYKIFESKRSEIQALKMVDDSTLNRLKKN